MKTRPRKLPALGLLGLTLALACSSISGHRIVSTEDGGIQTVKNVKGLPIVVQTPTGALFILTKSRYRVTRFTPAVDPKTQERTWKPIDTGEEVESILSDKPLFLGPSHVYSIDPKRPFAGTLDYEIQLENQYPKVLKGKVDEKTLEQMAKLLQDLAAAALKGVIPPIEPKPEDKSRALVRTQRTLVSKSISLVTVDLATGKVDINDL